MLVLSSPKRDNYKKVLNAVGATIRFMPVWSWQEVESCHQLLYADDPERPLAEVRDAFERWGGIPRFVLEKLRDEAAQQSLQEALDTAEVGIIRKSIGQIDAAQEASHRILHIQTQQPFVYRSIAFGSAYIRDRVAELLFLQQRQAMIDFLITSSSSPQLAGVRGELFESYAHRIISSGGSFKVRRLDDGSEETLKLERCAGTHFVRSPSDLAECPSQLHYCQPVVRNFPAIDAVTLPGSLFQMTVSLMHPVKYAALKVVLDSMPDCSNYNLFFVVPDDVFPTFSSQSIVGSEETAVDARFRRLKQWALCIKL